MKNRRNRELGAPAGFLISRGGPANLPAALE